MINHTDMIFGTMSHIVDKIHRCDRDENDSNYIPGVISLPQQITTHK